MHETGFFFTLQNTLSSRLEVNPAKEMVLESYKKMRVKEVQWKIEKQC